MDNPTERLRIVADDNIPFLEGRLDNVADVTFTDQFGFTPEMVRDADAILIRTRTPSGKPLLEGSRVKLVATATIGMDQIDIPWCESAGIEVANSPGCNAPGVAQYVWASLLHCGVNPESLKIGVVGKGNVGSIVTEWGRRLGAEVLVCDPPRAERGLTDEDYLPLETLLKECDVVTLHTPLIKDGKHPTFHLISDKELALMRPGAWIVNAARGPVTDTPALKKRLSEGNLHAIIDTWENEPDADTELMRMADIATFHIAGYSFEGKQRATRMVLEAVERKFGVEVDKSGLAGNYQAPKVLTPQTIMDSYDPRRDMNPLLKDPTAFDTLRRNYDFRHEVKA